MRAHVLQHVSFEGLGSIDTWLRDRRAEVTLTRFHEDATLPDPAACDLVVAMGGPMSVNDEAGFPWLRPEKEFLAAAIGRGAAVLGVCLGAQLIASSLGARVYRNPEPEIGWFPVETTGDGEAVFSFPRSFDAFHWHGETFDLPAGAVLVARSAGCAHQAFRVGARALGLQFHLETTPEAADEIVTHCRGELAVPGRFVQSEAVLRAKPVAAYREMNALMAAVLDRLTGHAG